MFLNTYPKLIEKILCRCGVIQDLQKVLNNPTIVTGVRLVNSNLGLREKVKDGNLPVIYQGQKKGV